MIDNTMAEKAFEKWFDDYSKYRRDEVSLKYCIAFKETYFRSFKAAWNLLAPIIEKSIEVMDRSLDLEHEKESFLQFVEQEIKKIGGV